MDELALQVLVDRHWRTLFGRCRLLASDADMANDLANETWYRVLRARRSLDPDKHFAGYLVTIATNLWRDWSRRVARGGPGSARERSLDAPLTTDDGEVIPLANVLPDPSSLDREAQTLLRMDLDDALARLPPHHREVLLARFLDGESAAEIGRRYGRTEQTITSWVRQAIREIRRTVGVAGGGPAPELGDRAHSSPAPPPH